MPPFRQPDGIAARGSRVRALLADSVCGDSARLAYFWRTQPCHANATSRVEQERADLDAAAPLSWVDSFVDITCFHAMLEELGLEDLPRDSPCRLK
eukprot:751766-Pleurochrysis_carterae.AAC.2